jgi:hypothetical protein
MIRIAVEIVLLFLLPTVAYFVYALLARPAASPAAVFNEAPYLWLSDAGAALVGAFLIYYGWTSGGAGMDEAVAPARSIDGRAVPGGAK